MNSFYQSYKIATKRTRKDYKKHIVKGIKILPKKEKKKSPKI